MGLFGAFNLSDIMGPGLSLVPPSPPADTSWSEKPTGAKKKGGLFGGWNTPGEDGSTKWDKVAMLGASMRDDPSIAANLQERMAQQQRAALAQQQLKAKQAAEQSLSGGLFGSSAPKSAPPPSILPVGDFGGFTPPPQAQASAGGAPGAMPSISDPAVIQRLLAAKSAGVDIDPYLEVLKASQPQVAFAPDGQAINSRDPSVVGQRFANPTNVNNTVLDLNDPKNLGRTVPTLDKGQQFLYDDAGRPVAIRNMDGSVQAAAQMAGAVEGAKSAAQSQFAPDNRTDATGVPIYGVQADRLAGPQRGQAPAEAARAKAVAEAEAAGQVRLPAAMQTANQTLGLIQQVRDHPGRRFGTGATALIPGIPGTPQQDFIDLVAQVKGKAFLEAFASLKGSGAITEMEGQKATEAIARLNRGQSETGFLKALDELEQIINTGIERSKQQAGRASNGALPGVSRSDIAAEMKRRGLM